MKFSNEKYVSFKFLYCYFKIFCLFEGQPLFLINSIFFSLRYLYSYHRSLNDGCLKV